MFNNHGPRLSRRRLLAAAAGASVAFERVTVDARPSAPWADPAVRRLSDSTPIADQTSAPVAVQVSQGQGLDHSQPVVAVDPKDAKHLLAASRVGGPKGIPHVAAFASFDGGQTWRETSPLPLPAGVSAATDATVAIDGAGNGWISAFAPADASPARGEIVVWRTTDGGRGFDPPTVAGSTDEVAPRPWMGADEATSGHLWLVWAASEGVMFTASVDGGATFDPPRVIATVGGAVSAPVLAAGPAGTVSVAFGVSEPARAGTPVPNAADELTAVSSMLVRSTDGGATFSAPATIGSMALAAAPGPEFRLPTNLSIAVDPNGAGVFLAYATFDAETGQSGILVAASTDGAQSFAQPVEATGDARLERTVYVQPQIVVDARGGVDVTYFAIDASQPQLSYDLFLTRSADQGKRFGARARISNASRGVAVEGADENGLYHWLGGAYQGLAAGPETLHPMWTDVERGIVTAAIPISATVGMSGTPTA